MNQKPTPVDLDRYRELARHPARDPQQSATRRATLLHQLGWLADEAAALAPMLRGLPAWALEGTPLPSDRSVKETLAHLARLDRHLYPRWIERLERGERPELTSADAEPVDNDDANDRDLGALLEDLRCARAALIARVEAVQEDGWQQEATLEGAAVTLDDLLLRIVRRDADLLRALAYRLHEAELTDRAQDLPK